MKMDTEKRRWSRLYRVALRQHLAHGSKDGMSAAVRLGRRAVALGLDSLDVAQVHEQALQALSAPGRGTAAKAGRGVGAKRFFMATVALIEKTHRTGLSVDAKARHLTRTLKRRTEESVASARDLKQGIVQRQAAESALKKSGVDRHRLEQASSRLQHRLRDQTHAILAAHEQKRQQASHQLRDDIAQTLLAIHVRLLALKQSAKASTSNLTTEVAETQRVVRQSALTIRRLARTLGMQHEA